MHNLGVVIQRLPVFFILFSSFSYLSIQYSKQTCLNDPLVISYFIFFAIVSWLLSGPILHYILRRFISTSKLIPSAIIGGLVGIVAFSMPIIYPDIIHLDVKITGYDKNNDVKFWSVGSNVNRACFKSTGWEEADDMFFTTDPQLATLSAVMIITDDFPLGFSSPKINGNIKLSVDGLLQDIALEDNYPNGANIVTIQGNYQPYKAVFLAILLKLYRSFLIAISIFFLSAAIYPGSKEKSLSLLLIFWIASVMVVYVLLFPPEGFWMIIDKIGISHILRNFRISIIHFFYDTVSINY